jgi:hypothetical protein
MARSLSAGFERWAFGIGRSHHDRHGERHLCHLLGLYQRYYNDARTHLSLNKDAPVSRVVQAVGRIVPNPHLGGLHHQYVRI